MQLSSKEISSKNSSPHAKSSEKNEDVMMAVTMARFLLVVSRDGSAGFLNWLCRSRLRFQFLMPLLNETGLG